MKLKVIDGTRQSSGSLCHSCTRSIISRGTALGQEIIRCQANYEMPITIAHPIVECNMYYDKNLPSLQSMIEIATLVSVDKRTGRVGFRTAEQDAKEGKDRYAHHLPTPFD